MEYSYCGKLVFLVQISRSLMTSPVGPLSKTLIKLPIFLRAVTSGLLGSCCRGQNAAAFLNQQLKPRICTGVTAQFRDIPCNFATPSAGSAVTQYFRDLRGKSTRVCTCLCCQFFFSKFLDWIVAFVVESCFGERIK